jgi:hypothetical protein
VFDHITKRLAFDVRSHVIIHGIGLPGTKNEIDSLIMLHSVDYIAILGRKAKNKKGASDVVERQ